MHTNNFNPREIIDFLHLTARLKSELRHCCDASGERRESVAEHSFQMSLFAVILDRYLEHTVDITRVLKMCLCHDLVEAITGDVPYVEGEDRAAKRRAEEAGMEQLVKGLSPALADEIRGLWEEFEARESIEARCAKALDSLEAQIQHNIAPLSSWEEREYAMVFTKLDRWCEHDSALKALCQAIKEDACAKMREEGVDPEQYREGRLKG